MCTASDCRNIRNAGDARNNDNCMGPRYLDEYTDEELSYCVQVINQIAALPICDGNVGMWGTSYSGFNSLQLAVERPPALKAICAWRDAGCPPPAFSPVTPPVNR